MIDYGSLIKPVDWNINNQNSVLEDKRKILNACQQFESIFINQVLQSMRKSYQLGGLFEESNSMDLYQSMFYQKIAEFMAKSMNSSLAVELYKQIQGESPEQELFQQQLTKLTKIFIDKNPVVKKDPIVEVFLKKLSPYNHIIHKEAEKNGISTNLVRAVILNESNGNSNAVSSAGAKGLMQLMDRTAIDMGIDDVFNPEQNIKAGVKYLSMLIKRFDSDIDSTLAAYNAGPQNVIKYNGIPPFTETINYVKRVKDTFSILERMEVK